MSTSFGSAGMGQTSPSEAIFFCVFFFCYWKDFLDSISLLLSRTAISCVPDYNMKSKKQLLSSGMKFKYLLEHIVPLYLNLSHMHRLRSDNFRMSLWSHHFSQNTNKKLSGFLLCVVKADILTIFCSYFVRNDDFINSFWNWLTFRVRDRIK